MQFGIIIKSETWDKSYHGEGWLETIYYSPFLDNFFTNLS